MHAFLIAVLIITAATWIGGLPTLVVVRCAANRTLSPASNVALFRAIGRLYGIVAGTSLMIASLCGALLAGWPSTWHDWQILCATLTAAIVVTTALGVMQARGITRRRQAVVDGGDPSATNLRRTVRAAAILRGLIAVLTIAVIVVVSLELAR